MSAADRAKALREQLSHHGHRYYVLDDPEIGDDAYDALLDELRAIEREHPGLVTPDSPTQRIGGEPVSRLEKVRHLQPMLSLANARSEEELRAWVERMRHHLAREGIEAPAFEFVAEPKIDGLAISLLYEDGVLLLPDETLVSAAPLRGLFLRFGPHRDAIGAHLEYYLRDWNVASRTSARSNRLASGAR